MNNYYERYNSFKVDDYNSIQKWSPKLKLIQSNDVFLKYVSIFAEKYLLIQSQLEHYCSTMNPFHAPSIETPLPKDFIRIEDAIKMISDRFNHFILNSQYTRLNIVSEYYNVITNKRGLLLEHGLMVEDNKLLDNKHQIKIEREIKRVIDDTIFEILNPKIRNRKYKIESILKEDRY